MKKELVDKIKSRGYWRINFQPLIDIQKIRSMKDAREIIKGNTVRLRGWDYPHFPQREGEDTGKGPCGEYYEGWIDWANHKEFWRIYKSGQFLHYLALREDWLEEDPWRTTLAKEILPMTKLGVVGSVVYQITEIFEFLSRLNASGIYDEGVHVSIFLNNVKDRELWIESSNRFPFPFPHKTSAKALKFEKDLTKDQILSMSKDVALDFILDIFDNFEWNPLRETIEKDQDKFLSGRI